MLRFAPSPTGDMHIGNLRAAIFNFLMAKKLKERFIIRIEDTDVERNIQHKDKEILKLLEIFGLEYDDVVYQSQNFALHRDLAHRLVNTGVAFYCYCSKEFLESKRQEAKEKKIAFRYEDDWAELEKGSKSTSPIIRLRGGQDVSFIDSIKGRISFSAAQIQSFVIMRNDVPTYNFACSIDDKEMSYIIRGEDHISNTPKQILIKKALGFSLEQKYAHLPIILNSEGKKMSKRDSASSVQWLLAQGLESRAVANYLILLGNAKIAQTFGEGFGYDDILSVFDVSDISSTPAHFDYKKLVQINRDIFRSKRAKSFWKVLESCVLGSGSILDSDDSGVLESSLCLDSKGLDSSIIDSRFNPLISLYLSESNNINELQNHFKNTFQSLESKREKTEYKAEFDTILKVLRECDFEKLESYDDFKNLLISKTNLKGKNLFKPLRMILSGSEHGVEIDKLYEAIRGLI